MPSTGVHVDMNGAVCLVTGATSGIGKETALALARLGATVVLHGRNRERGDVALAEIQDKTANANLHLLVADLASQRDVRQLAEDFRSKFDQLHVLVNNAGIVTNRRELTQDGIERTMAVNHLAPFLLTQLLLDVLKKTGNPERLTRVITVASDAHRAGRTDFDDLTYARGFSGMRVYCDSKLANVLFTYELARRLAGTHVTATCIHPGAVGTSWGQGGGRLLSLGWRLFGFLMLSPERGARPTIYAATSPDLNDVSGAYFTQKGLTRSSPASYDTEAARRLWEESARLTGTAHGAH
ncbi:MAG TPA: SDR family oxidoreductase [Chloroflexota bacterium]|nr:SDR family oxidoreductase [Chloroflexota bacterium]